ncbi:MAG: hypothetical protein HQL90_16050 [Magnetococcales bacterium]|nr:hypothetical protein [Magnetococcales bacterium]
MPIPTKTASNRSFGLVFTVFFALIGLQPMLDGHGIRVWSLACAALFLLLALLQPERLTPLNNGWTRFGLLLHRITTPIVMAILFITILTPIGLLMRLLGKRPLALSYEPTAASYWVRRENPTPESMKRPF